MYKMEEKDDDKEKGKKKEINNKKIKFILEV
jgi:hypothetical protein